MIEEQIRTKKIDLLVGHSQGIPRLYHHHYHHYHHHHHTYHDYHYHYTKVQ
jgi:hypothetical protein